MPHQHETGSLHQGYAKMRTKLKQLQEKYGEDPKANEDDTERFIGTGTGWLIRIGPVSDRFQTAFKPVSDQFQTSAIVGSAESMSQPLSSPMPSPNVIRVTSDAQSTCRMHRTRSVISDVRSVMSDAQS